MPTHILGGNRDLNLKISVAIPAYNCASTIRETLDSVLCQSVQADEILVLNDGSTDDTLSILKFLQAPNRRSIPDQPRRREGAEFVMRACTGNVIAWLDSDDIWHPRYLEVQRSLIEEHPNAVAYFTGHVNFTGGGTYEWVSDPFEQYATAEVIPPLQFLERYNRATGPFNSVSHCCVPKQVFTSLGNEAFKFKTAEDLLLFNLVAPAGPVVYLPKPMTAYRVRGGSLSTDRLKAHTP